MVLAAIALIVGPGSGAALAEVRTTDFLVRHDFEFDPGGTVTPQVTGLYYLHAWTRINSPYCAEAEVLPFPQPVGFEDLGVDHWVDTPAGIRVENQLAGFVVDLAQVPVPPTGFSGSFGVSAGSGCSPQQAEANAEFGVDPFLTGTIVKGFISSYGMVKADEAPTSGSRSYAFGTTFIEVQGGAPLANGTIKWMPTLRDVVGDSVSGGFQLDPISFVVEDLQTAGVVEGTLLSVSVDLAVDHAPGRFRWEYDWVDINGEENGRFEIDMTSPYLASPGYLELEFDGAEVTVSNDSGVFEGVLPAVGTLLPLGFALPSEQVLQYDLGSFDGHDLAVKFFMGGGAEGDDPSGNPLSDVPVVEAVGNSVMRLESYPNPFNPQTTIAFELRSREAVSLGVFDLSGRLVKRLVEAEEYAKGSHEVQWNGRDDNGHRVPSGAYFYRLEAGQYSESRRMALIK